MLAVTRLKYVVESEWGSRRYLDVTLLERWPRRRANLWGLSESAQNLDGILGHPA